MSTDILRVYDPHECHPDGVPLHWESCRWCYGEGVHLETGAGCRACDGHGSLKAAALAAMQHSYAQERPRGNGPLALRCEGCGHPRSEGTWEDGGFQRSSDEWLVWAATHLRQGRAPPAHLGGTPATAFATHYSPCDKGCTHDLTGTRTAGLAAGKMAVDCHPLEASWRPVEVRALGWPHDLRPEKIAVLCLRCWAMR